MARAVRQVRANCAKGPPSVSASHQSGESRIPSPFPLATGYIAPELLRGDNFTQAVDLWSFGMVLFETWTRRAPYESEMRAGNAMQVMANVMLHGTHPALPAAEDPVDDAIHALYSDCCQREPKARPTFEAVLERLEEAARMLAAQGSESGLGNLRTKDSAR